VTEPGYRTADYEPAQRGAFLELMRSAWGEEAITAEEFDWWFERNPTGERLIAVAIEGGEVLGVAGTSCLPLRLGGREQIGTFSLHATTREDARGRGIFGRLELHNEKRAQALGAGCALCFPNDATTPVFLQQLGWSDVGSFRIWARPSSARALLERRSARHRTPAAASEPEDAARRRYGKIAVTPLTRFGPSTDAIYERAMPAWPNHVVRRAEHMNWRYLDSPRRYRAFAAIADGEAAAYVVVGRKRFRGAKLGVIADCVAPAGSFGPTRALLRRAVAELRQGSDLLAALVPNDRAQRRAFLSLGFVPTTKQLRFVGRSYLDDLPFPADRADWHFSLGDADFF
jgi:GNAT superfamily N-acetyltransferase